MASGSSRRRTSWTRAKDSDRNQTCEILDTALADGQLSMTEHGERVKTATTATTLGQLQDLVSDLQTDRKLDVPVITKIVNRSVPAWRAGWGIKAAIAAVLVLFGVAIGWGLYGNTSSPLDFTSDPGAKDDGITATVLTAPRQLQSLGGFTGLFEQMRKKFGSTMGYELDIHSDVAYLDRPDPQDNRRSLSYQYRGGWGVPTGSPSTVDADDRLVDLSAFDFEKTLAVLRGARRPSASPAPTSPTPGCASAPPKTLPPRSRHRRDHRQQRLRHGPDRALRGRQHAGGLAREPLTCTEPRRATLL